MTMQRKRQTAYKFWIKDLSEAETDVNEEGFMYFKVKGKNVVRVNVLATIIHKYVSESGNYVFVTIDDGSAQMRVKAWGEDTQILANYNVGDLVRLVGKLGLNNNEIFIRAEALKVIENSDWELVRRLELLKEFGKPEPSEKVSEEKKESYVEEEVVSNNTTNSIREKIISEVENASNEGVEEEELFNKINANKEDIEKAIKELLSEGEIFEPKPGYIKLIG